MQPSVKWKTISPFISATTGINERTGAADFNDPDFTSYPPFTTCVYPGVGGQDSNMFWWYTNGDFPLNTPIDDWSVAYTAVDNPDLSLNNIGIFMSNPDDPAFYTDNAECAPIAFYTSLGYKIIFDNIGGTPFLNDQFRFKNPPYNNSRYVWSPGAGGAMYSGDLGIFYRDANCEGYAAMLATFGLKSLFLEIRVRPINIIPGESLPLQDYSLKTYAGLSEQQRAANPISNAYCMVHRRAATNGTYSQVNSFYTDINLVMGKPLKGYSSDIYTYFNNVHNTANIETMYLPLWGIPYKGRAGNYIRYCDGNYSDPNGQNTSDFFYGYDRADGTIVQSIGGGEYHYTKYISGTDENIEYLRQCCAAYGLFFCEDIYTSDNKNLESSELEANNGRWLHNDMYLGIIEDNGYTQGRYTRGLQNGMQDQFNWTDSTESIYDPDVPPTPPSPYDTRTVFNEIGNIASLTRRYALTAAAVEELGSELWTISADLINNIQNDEWNKYTAEVLDTFLVNDPLSCIVSLQKYPMSLPEQSGPVHVKLGKAETNIEANITSATTHTYAFTPQLIQPKYGNSFLDYEPYTHMELYVPFCGTISLDPRDYLGHYLNIRLVVDFTTGTCVAYVMSDDLVIDTVNGSLAVSIPVTGIDSTTLAANITNGIINTRNARYSHIFGTLGKIASPRGILSNISNVWGSAEAILSSEENARAAEYSLSHQTAPPHTIGSASPVGSWAIDFSARLLIYYPTGEVIDNSKEYLAFNDAVLYRYMDQVGIATIDPVDNVGSKYRGLVAATAPVLENMVTATGEPATDPELQLIARALEEGIII